MIEIVIPYPPSANRSWRTGNGRAYLSADVRKYRIAVQVIAQEDGIEPLSGDVFVRLAVYRPRKAGDLDGRIKQALDALQGIAYADDKQIVSIYAHRHDDKDRPRIEVTVGRAI